MFVRPSMLMAVQIHFTKILRSDNNDVESPVAIERMIRLRPGPTGDFLIYVVPGARIPRGRFVLFVGPTGRRPFESSIVSLADSTVNLLFETTATLIAAQSHLKHMKI